MNPAGSTRALRGLAWALVGLLVVIAVVRPPERRAGRTPLFLFAPFAELAAEVQWVRFQGASLRGETARALELAESALALDPTASAGWERLAAHLAYDLASREREPDLARRRAWFEAGLEVLARGAVEAEPPGELLVFRALLLAGKAATDPALAAGGERELMRAAAAALEEAAAQGDPRAAALAAEVRAEAGRAE
jgi:hypothetical protein